MRVPVSCVRVSRLLVPIAIICVLKVTLDIHQTLEYDVVEARRLTRDLAQLYYTIQQQQPASTTPAPVHRQQQQQQELEQRQRQHEQQQQEQEQLEKKQQEQELKQQPHLQQKQHQEQQQKQQGHLQQQQPTLPSFKPLKKQPQLPKDKKKHPLQDPSFYISCLQTLAEPFLAQLTKLRIRYLNDKGRSTTGAIGRKNGTKLFSEDPRLFSKLEHYSHIDTLFLNASMRDIKKCLLPEYSYRFSSNNCTAALETPKRYSLHGKPVLGMTCIEEHGRAVTRENLDQKAFNVGLPLNFSHDLNGMTLTYIHVVRPAIIMNTGDLFTDELEIVPQRCRYDRHRNLWKLKHLSVTYHKEIFTVAQYFGAGMFHGNVEELSRLVPFLPFLQSNPEIKIHIVGSPVFLSLLGLSPDRFIGGHVHGDVVYMPAGTGCCLPKIYNLQLESFFLRQSLPNLWHQRDHIILIQRTNGRRYRYFKQHKAIAQSLEATASTYGLKLWIFSDDQIPPLQETASMFNRAVLVVAPHGAGQTNLLFTQPGTALVEALCKDPDDGLVNMVYRNVIHLLGGYYFGLYNSRPWHCTRTTPEDMAGAVTYFVEHILQEMKTQK